MDLELRTVFKLLYSFYVESILVNQGYTAEEAKWIINNPIQGPPVPKSLELQRKLGGKPYGKYTRSSSRKLEYKES